MEKQQLICMLAGDLFTGFASGDETMAAVLSGRVGVASDQVNDAISACVEVAEKIVNKVYRNNPVANTGGR